MTTRSRTVALAAVLDILFVLLFVLIGRREHGSEGALLGFVTTAWPFLTGLAIGWLVTLAWRHPLGVVTPGVGIWLATVAGGMLLRLLSGQGVQFTFIAVAVLALAAFLLGWRLIAHAIRRRRTTR
ncbi:DUF3054 domain-containing protein [Salinibacterium sp. ZJ450]|uniref:DUF3054 domain-containing protein n=1 Tax=Salinibacterium sp. ZJ450 TaxID=2708338 RepID=UPI00141E5B79|nr:DUF3054 domain-containing protein [Salinibacterium sp. ZJ450]